MKTKLTVLISLFIVIIQSSTAQNLEHGFRNPPESAKPRTWWHWTNGNITKEGITKDLEWMKRSGIGGMQLADVASGQGQVTAQKYFSEHLNGLMPSGMQLQKPKG